MNSPPTPDAVRLEVATLGGGCFWCLEAVYDELEGVVSVDSGYMGGRPDNPGYKAVCSGETGHAEVVQVRFDPGVIGYREILEVFFVIHDPTTLNRQGNDVGSQYRSVIFYHSPEQQAVANGLIEELIQANDHSRPIVTEVAAAGTFWRAEDYHQEFFQNNPYQPYCQAVVAPKVAKFRVKFGHRLKQAPKSA